MVTVIYDSFYFEFLFSRDQVRWWPRVIGPVLFRFAIWGQQTCVKYVMDGPGWGECEFISDWQDLLCNKKGAMTSGGQFERLIRKG